jgi:hypothetical protein
MPVKCAGVEEIVRQACPYKNFHSISSPKIFRHTLGSLPSVEIHAQPASHARVCPCHLDFLKINFETVSPRQHDRIFAEPPAPA